MTQQRNLALRRLLAFLVDYGVMVLFVAVLSATGFAIRAQLGLTPSAPTTFKQKLLAQALIVATVTLPIVIYFAVSESSRWQATIGKRVLRLQVKAYRGGRPPLLRTLLRAVAKFAPWELAHTGVWHVPGTPFVSEPAAFNYAIWITATLLALWWFASLWLGDGRTPYDRIAGTVVTRCAKRPSPKLVVNL